MKNIYLIENHNSALKIWRQKDIKALDLVHLDAHIDFGFHAAKPIEKIIDEAKSLKELKEGMERSIAFMYYEKDFDKQTHIGNYIYPAMESGIVKNFYWVIPGGFKEFKKSWKSIKNILRNLVRNKSQKINIKKMTIEKKGIITTKLLGRDFIICTLERLPILRKGVLLDIDTDFLVIDSLLNAGSTAKIGKRKPWVSPQDLVGLLKKRIKKPKLITIAYSVNGGWTPLEYKHLGDEIANYFAPRKFKERFKKNCQAAKYFNLFTSTGKRQHYQKAIRLNPTYRVQDNNYGPLYLSLRKFSFAKKEFSKILRVDPKNPACLLGLGNIALERREFKNAKKYFSFVSNSKDNKLFDKVKRESLLGLAKADFNLKNFDKAKKLFFRYQKLESLQSQSYYFLGRIFEKEKDFERSAIFYKDVYRLGFDDIKIIWRLLQILRYLKEKKNITKYIVAKYSKFKREFTKEKTLLLKKGKKIRGLYRIEKTMARIEEMLQDFC